MSLLNVRYQPLPPHTSERELADSVLGRLSPWFDYQREVRGTHCGGRRLRIDAVAWPRDPSTWKDEHPVFGIEFKAIELMTFDAVNFTRWAAQAVDYTHVDWNGYGHLRVFTCPSPVKDYREAGEGTDAAYLVTRLLWQLGVGELANLEGQGWSLLGQGQHLLWSETLGAHEAKRWSIKPKSGNRG
ncbi:hypothetical protein AB0K15_47115 [Amycolatopsis sp. NPDC049253]|uniref:hypothetical protein n=1 Tax=Amycolatopsis sp. NPDC049253 TaxID=3155274 RepID=UPI0034466685